MEEEIRYKETKYGFIYGAAEIKRVLNHKGHVVICIKTPKEVQFIRVTPSGFIRVEDKMKRSDYNENNRR